MSQPRIASLIVAAGLSGRMKLFKPLADYKGESFVCNIISKLNSVCEKIVVITGFNSEKLKEVVIDTFSDEKELLKKLNFVYNENYEMGMFTSLQKGMAEAKKCDWILYHFVDQPGVPNNFYQEFITHIDSKNNWIQPSHTNQHGHPILIGKDLFDLILNSSPDSNLRAISKNPIVKKKYWECKYKEIFQDIDTEEDFSNLE